MKGIYSQRDDLREKESRRRLSGKKGGRQVLKKWILETGLEATGEEMMKIAGN